MTELDPAALIARLSPTCRRSLEQASQRCVDRTHYNVEIEHWLLEMIAPADGDAAAILRLFEIDSGRVAADLQTQLEKVQTGNTRDPRLSPELIRLLHEGWMLASVRFGQPRIRSGHLIAALLSEPSLARHAREMSPELARVSAETLLRDLETITGGNGENEEARQAKAVAPTSPPTSLHPALDQFTVDLTARARAGAIDPVLGRDPEIRQLIDVLMRRRQNNPILTGEAGVGKTAVVEGFARRIAAGDVPPALRGVVLRSLDLGLLQAGAGVKGEFENRLRGVIDEVKASAEPIIMFIDEAHTLIGAGGAAGQNDAANLLKPALARGEMRTVAATTWAEYKKYFERDPALTRRFQVIKIEEPDEATAIEMINGLVPTLERHHKVRILSDGVTEAVRLSRRYIPARQLPDKAVSLLDTACARVAISQNATPAAIEDLHRQIESCVSRSAILEREQAIGLDSAAALADQAARRARLQDELDALDRRWQSERDLVARIRALQDRLSAQESVAGPTPEGPGERQAARDDLARCNTELRTLQGETPLVKVTVDAQAVAEVVANWTGIPVGRMLGDEIRTVLTLRERLEERVIGQPHALEAIAETMRVSRAGMTDPRKPIGVFLMVGTSGTGKTETALALAELLYGGEQNLTVINMSEFKEEHKVSMLVGSPPGYVGYGEGGVLTEAVRRRPYGVILLDEMEKAHPGVQDVFYQVFDKGMLRDGEGRDIDFRNTVIIMTSNAASERIARLCADPATRPTPPELAEALRPDLLRIFKPAFLGRVTTVPYFPLAPDVIRRIVELQLERIRRRFADGYRAPFSWSSDLVETIARRCTEVESGARNIEHILGRTLLPELAIRLLGRRAAGAAVTRVEVGLDPAGGLTYQIE